SSSSVDHLRRTVPSFPTRRSSDLGKCGRERIELAIHLDPQRLERALGGVRPLALPGAVAHDALQETGQLLGGLPRALRTIGDDRSEEHTSELQSRFDLVCRLLLEK